MKCFETNKKGLQAASFPKDIVQKIDGFRGEYIEKLLDLGSILEQSVIREDKKKWNFKFAEKSNFSFRKFVLKMFEV